MDYAFEFIIKNKGIDTEDDYPYRGRDGTCIKDKVICSFTFLFLFFSPTYIIDSIAVHLYLSFHNETVIIVTLLYSLQLKRHVVTIDSYVDVPSRKEKKLLQAVATQPVSVGICGSDYSFQLYSGVSTSKLFLYLSCLNRFLLFLFV